MRIEHLAVWTDDPERLAAWYSTYFGAQVGARYRNESRQFESIFLSLGDGARLELMRVPGLAAGAAAPARGLAHFAVATGSEAAVDALTARLRADGAPVLDGPRRTGDGYYESVVLDPDGNRVEITV